MDCVKVALRIRPLIASEIDSGCRLCIERVNGEPQVCVGKAKQSFTFNYVFDENESQVQVYNVAVSSLLTNLFKGYNVTILAYGQTGSGKTYTMGTNYNGLGELGVIPRAIIEMFNNMNATSNKDYKVTVSFLELYNECFYDLLTNKPKEQSIVDVREHQNGIFIPGLTELEVVSMAEALTYLQQGTACRVTGSTAMNATSSRSHAIFTINIRIATKGNLKEVVKSKFQLVDLAGSERPKKTGSTGERFKEGVNINKGLLALGNVIAQLGDGAQYVNYRDSRLTRLLQDSLGGNSVTLMIACVSPADYNQEETLSTLRYADRAKRIKNKPVVNQDPQGAEISRLKKEIEELRLQIINGGAVCPPEHHVLEERLKISQEKTEKLSETLDHVLKQNMGLHERALLIDSWCEKMCDKLVELNHLSVNCDQDSEHLTEHLGEIRNKLAELKRDHEEIVSQLFSLERESRIAAYQSTSAAVKVDGSEVKQCNDPQTPGMENHIFARAKITKEIEEISKSLVWKEELINKLSESHTSMVKLQNESICKFHDLNHQLIALQSERVELGEQIHLAGSGVNTPAAKLAEERRVRFEQLEQKHVQLLKKVVEQEKVIRMKQKSEEKIANLKNEVSAMKQMKVRLIHELRAESNRFRILKNEKDREMHRLRNQNVKNQNMLMKMERLHSLKQNVLKRKLEAAAAANKRIMEAMERQKKGEKKLKATSTEQISQKISEEWEILVSAFDVENSLQTLIEDRASLKKMLAATRGRLEDPLISDIEKEDIEENMKELQDEIELRSVQISDLQQKLLDAQQEERGKCRWDSLRTIADAKFALTYLFDMAADLKKDNINKDAMYRDLKESEEALMEEHEKQEEKYTNLKNFYCHRHDELEREYEEKIYLLLKQNKNECLLNEELQKMDSLRQEVSALKHKVVELQAQLDGKVQVSSYQEAYDVFLKEDSNENKANKPMNVLKEINCGDGNEDSETVLDKTFVHSPKGTKRSFETGQKIRDIGEDDQDEEGSEEELKKRRFGEPSYFRKRSYFD